MRKFHQAVFFSVVGVCLWTSLGPRVIWSQEPGATKEAHPGRELTYKSINFIILVGGLAYILRKPMAEFFSSRSASISKSLDEGRKALEASQAQLREVEAKLGRLEAEIAAFQTSAESEMAAERKRMEQAAEDEAARMKESARSQAENMVRAAKLELQSYAALKAVSLAEELIRARMDAPNQQRLIAQFAGMIETSKRKN